MELNRPKKIKIVIGLLIFAWVLSLSMTLFNFYGFQIPPGSNESISSGHVDLVKMIYFYFLIYLFYGYLVIKISTGSHYAKLAFMGGTVFYFSVIAYLWIMTLLSHQSLFSIINILRVIFIGLNIMILILLLSQDAKRWFDRKNS